MPLPNDTNWFKKTLNKLGIQGLPGSLHGAPLIWLGINETAADALDAGDAGSEFMSEIASGNRTHGPYTLQNVTFINRVLDFDNMTGQLPDPDNENGPSEAFVCIYNTGVEATSPLIGYTRDASGLPLAQDGNADNVTLNAAGFLRIGGA